MQPLLLLLAFLLPSEPATGIIMGGHEAKPHSHPYMAWIQIMDEEMPSRCGGVLVQEDFVLTAAHCWGSWRERRKAMQTAAVRPLSLPRGQAQVRPGEVCHLAGWGQVNPRGRLSDTLQEVELTVQQDQVCKSQLDNYYNSTTQLCVGDPKEKKSSFKGDSGGPLVCKNVIQGIVSYGRISRTSPRAFTKVSSFLPWLNKMMKSL
nr:PREDICTED: granzyme B-like isoform X1 [Equus przewalskii]